MSERPCGDITCHCCYPDLRCDCNGQPDDAEPGTVYACPDCGRTAVAETRRDLPDAVRRHIEYAEAAIARYHAERGSTAPRQPTVSWRQLTPATRIPGAKV